MSFQIVFAVPLECQSCVDSISHVLKGLGGIKSYDIDLEDNLVTTTGTTPPSTIIKAIQNTGKDAIIRGTGQPNSAAVCILESFDPKDMKTPVKGLARIVLVSPKDIYVDLTISGLDKGVYYPSIRSCGNLSEGAKSTGPLFHELAPVDVTEAPVTINSLGAANTENDFVSSAASTIGTSSFSGQAFLHAPLSINDLIGRSVVISSSKGEVVDDSLCGVIARSAGVWENNKQVCSCSGKSVWEERVDARERGVDQ